MLKGKVKMRKKGISYSFPGDVVCKDAGPFSILSSTGCITLKWSKLNGSEG